MPFAGKGAAHHMLFNHANRYAHARCDLPLGQPIDDMQYKGLAATWRQALNHLHIAMHGLLPLQGLFGLQMLGGGRLIRHIHLV